MKFDEIELNFRMEVSGHHNILISIQGKIFLDWPAEWLADISLGMMEKYPRAINLAKINFGNALFFRDGECWTSSARIGNLLFHEKNNSSKRRRIKGKKKKKKGNNCTNLSNGDFYSESEKKVNWNSFPRVGIASPPSKTHSVWNAFRQFRSLCQLRAAITGNDGPVSSF